MGRQERQKKKALDEMKKKLEEKKAEELKKLEEMRKAAEKEAAEKAAAEKAAAEKAAAGETAEESKEGDQPKEEEKKEENKEEKAEEPAKEEEKKEEQQEEKKEEKEEEPDESEEDPDEPEPPDEDPPIVELTAEEKNVKFRPLVVPDMSSFNFGTTFTKITLPSKAEGFTEIKYDWAKADKSEEYVKNWILKKKQTTRMEDIQPSAWFLTKTAQWQKALKE